MAFLSIDDLSAYKISFNLSNYVWDSILNWDYFEKETMGKQFVRSIDSISANIAEGFGRYGKKNKIKFYRYSIGSLYESISWNEKARIRGLLTEKEYSFIKAELEKLPKDLNSLIKFTNEKLKY
jgi:four helix bundle protein